MIGGVLEISELHVMISMLDVGYCLYVPASRMLINLELQANAIAV
jgi:hypothetical protein